MIQGRASIANKTDENIEVMKTYKMLMAKYTQYERVGMGEMCIIITPENVIYWSKFQAGNGWWFFFPVHGPRYLANLAAAFVTSIIFFTSLPIWGKCITKNYVLCSH